jgi:hypothetical protein
MSDNLWKKQDAAAAQHCATPFASTEEANSAIQAFFEDVYQARLKHRLANVCIAIRDEIAETGPFHVSGHFGEALFVESIAAWYFGQAQAERQKLIMESMAQNPGIKNTGKKR